MARIVLADAGPLIALARLDAIFLLVKLFGGVVVPSAVHDECPAKETNDSQRIALAVAAGWLRVEMPTMPLPEMPRSLGEGEQQALSLALAHPLSLLLLDDRLARRQVEKLKLAFMGTVRLLFIAEQRGLIESAERCVEQLRQSGYRISPDFLPHIRQQGSP